MSLDHKSFQPEDLSEEELENMRQEVRDKISVARIGLLLNNPWFGNIATRLQVKTCDNWCPTAATDGRNLYYNTQFFNQLSEAQIKFVIAHEILHCVFDHMDRRGKRDPQLYNIAADYIVNNTLVRERIGDKVDQIPIFQDFKYDGWTSEEIYDYLFDQAEKIKVSGELLDDHPDWTEGDGSEDTDENGNSVGDKGDTADGRPVYSQEELDKINQEFNEAMISATQNTGAGNLPAEIKRVVQSLTEPKMDWREILQQQIQSMVKNDFTFTRPSRKSQAGGSGAVLPGMNFDETIELCVALDVSGSIDDEQVRDFLSEVQGITQQYQDFEVTVWSFSTEVYNKQVFAPHEENDDISQYQPTGGGGTDFMANWRFMEEEDIVPKKFLMFTDGMPAGSWGDPDYTDTVFVIHNRVGNVEAPFGMTVYYDENI